MLYEYTVDPLNSAQLNAEVTALGIPGYVTMSGSGSAVRIEYGRVLTPEEYGTLSATVAAHVPSAAFDQQVISKQASRDAAASTPAGQRDRAMVLVTKDEINLLRQWVTDFKAAVAASASLADLKTRVAALSNMPQRTAQQAKAALLAKINDAESN